MRASLLPLLLSTVLAEGACAGPEQEDRDALVRNVLTTSELSLLRTRPALMAGKWARMAQTPFAFYRGSLALYLRDARDGRSPLAHSRFALEQPLVLGIGDPHPENAGGLWASDGSVAIEPNDFDGADRVPYLRDVRRLAIGFAVAASTTSTPPREAARAVAAGYRASMAAMAAGAAPERFVDGRGSPNLDDILRRARRDFRKGKELEALTEVVDGRRRFKPAGTSLDPADPQSTLRALPQVAVEALADTLRLYRATLLAPPPQEFFRVLDAARVLGSGVASWPRVRVLVLVRGPTDAPEDDVVLELKELADATSGVAMPPYVYARTVADRVRDTSRRAWARPDAEPLWGTSTWLGLPVQIRLESEGEKTLRVARMTEALGTAEAVTATAGALGALLARVHATPMPSSPATRISERIESDGAGFEEEQADVALAYLAVIQSDLARFRRALHADPLLGFVPDRSDTPSPVQAALFADPPPPEVIP